jgi:precorrin-6A/cobalt-precorrin-6A reductase
MPMMVNQGLLGASAMMRALLLGGTGDANALADALVGVRIDAIYSYAGRTQIPLGHALPTRTGGFGGAAGLADYIRQQRITHVIDATHPFAVEMSRHAVEACAATNTPLIALERAPWTRVTGDNWIDVADIDTAVGVLPDAPTRVFLAIGRQHIMPFAAKPQHAYTLRFVDEPDGALPLRNAEVIVSRGPFTLTSDRELMASRKTEILVARNSGGNGARAKIDAARELGIPVIMIARPVLPERPRVESIEEVMAWLGHDARLGA